MPGKKRNNSSKTAKLSTDTGKQYEKKQTNTSKNRSVREKSDNCRKSNVNLSTKKISDKDVRGKRKGQQPVKEKGQIETGTEKRSDESDFDMDSSPPRPADVVVKSKGKYHPARSAARNVRSKRKTDDKEEDKKDAEQPAKRLKTVRKVEEVEAKKLKTNKEAPEKRKNQQKDVMSKPSKSVSDDSSLPKKKTARNTKQSEEKKKNHAASKNKKANTDLTGMDTSRPITLKKEVKLVLNEGKYRPAKQEVKISRAHKRKVDKGDEDNTEQPTSKVENVKAKESESNIHASLNIKSEKKDETAKSSSPKKKSARKTKQTEENSRNRASTKNKKVKIEAVELKKEDLPCSADLDGESASQAASESLVDDIDQVGVMSSDGSSESEWEEVEGRNDINVSKY